MQSNPRWKDITSLTCRRVDRPCSLCHGDIDNLDILLRLLLIRLRILDLMHHVQALYRSPEDGMFVV